MASVRIFKYPTRKTAVLVTGNERTYNMPIQNSKIRVYKGANQPLDFTIFDADGKPLHYDGTNKHLELKVYDNRTRRIAFIKRLEKVEQLTQADTAGALMPSVRGNNHKQSVYRTVVQVSDAIDLPAGGHYRWVVQANDTKYNPEFFYSNLGEHVEGELELLNGGAPIVEPSYVVDEDSGWRSHTRADVMDENIVGNADNVYAQRWTMYTSDGIPGDVQLNVHDGMHTMSIKGDKFTGFIQVHGCLEDDLPDDMSYHRWFPIPLKSGQVNLEYWNFTGIDALNFHGNFNWLRVVYYQRNNGSQGEIKRILIRR